MIQKILIQNILLPNVFDLSIVLVLITKILLVFFTVLYLEIVMQKNEKKAMELVLALVKNLIERIIFFGFIPLLLRKDIVILPYLLFKVE